MTRRCRDWNEGLAQNLRNKKFAQEFILACLEEDIPIQITLGKVIRAYGLKEFAEKTGFASPNLVRAISPKHNPTFSTINRLLKPFNLKITVTAINKGGKSEGAIRFGKQSKCVFPRGRKVLKNSNIQKALDEVRE